MLHPPVNASSPGSILFVSILFQDQRKVSIIQGCSRYLVDLGEYGSLHQLLLVLPEYAVGNVQHVVEQYLDKSDRRIVLGYWLSDQG